MTTEKNLVRKCKRQFDKIGKFYRLENIGVSVPDAVFICKGCTWFIEFKMAYSLTSCLFQPTQLAWWVEVSEDLNAGLIIVEQKSGDIAAYDFLHVLDAPRSPQGTKVKVDLQEFCEPLFLNSADAYRELFLPR